MYKAFFKHYCLVVVFYHCYHYIYIYIYTYECSYALKWFYRSFCKNCNTRYYQVLAQFTTVHHDRLFNFHQFFTGLLNTDKQAWYHSYLWTFRATNEAQLLVLGLWEEATLGALGGDQEVSVSGTGRTTKCTQNGPYS